MEILNINSDRKNLRNVRVGKDVKIFDFVNAYDCTIGDNTKGLRPGAFVSSSPQMGNSALLDHKEPIGLGQGPCPKPRKLGNFPETIS